jgi:dolichyl-diphosphooligosaccharide--protein glycosyltransferase
MVRLMLVLAPATCCLAGVAVSDILNTLCCSLKAHGPTLTLPGVPAAAAEPGASDAGAGTPYKGGKPAARRGGKGVSDAGDGAGLSKGPFVSKEWNPLPKAVAFGGFAGIVVLLVMYTIHCIG